MAYVLTTGAGIAKLEAGISKSEQTWEYVC